MSSARSSFSQFLRHHRQEEAFWSLSTSCRHVRPLNPPCTRCFLVTLPVRRRNRLFMRYSVSGSSVSKLMTSHRLGRRERYWSATFPVRMGSTILQQSLHSPRPLRILRCRRPSHASSSRQTKCAAQGDIFRRGSASTRFRGHDRQTEPRVSIFVLDHWILLRGIARLGTCNSWPIVMTCERERTAMNRGDKTPLHSRTPEA